MPERARRRRAQLVLRPFAPRHGPMAPATLMTRVPSSAALDSAASSRNDSLPLPPGHTLDRQTNPAIRPPSEQIQLALTPEQRRGAGCRSRELGCSVSRLKRDGTLPRTVRLSYRRLGRPMNQPITHVLMSSHESISAGTLDPSRPAALTIDSGDIVSCPDTWTQWGNRARFGMSFADREPLRRQFPSGSYSNLGPVEVRGAEPGDVLECRMTPNKPIDCPRAVLRPRAETSSSPGGAVRCFDAAASMTGTAGTSGTALDAEDSLAILQLVARRRVRDPDGYVELFTEDAVLDGAMGPCTAGQPSATRSRTSGPVSQPARCTPDPERGDRCLRPRAERRQRDADGRLRSVAGARRIGARPSGRHPPARRAADQPHDHDRRRDDEDNP